MIEADTDLFICSHSILIGLAVPYVSLRIESCIGEDPNRLALPENAPDRNLPLQRAILRRTQVLPEASPQHFRQPDHALVPR